ncbi:pseudouridylate synthase RPUSD2-like isoform X2 [Palaemon carinicauda]|uniref:pseudouridylate synthase RPUSD2-like isoform X2 n=1 Tax=Palaemon carinicauda TaxID=392227 RepID=UPI0035B68964
MQPTWFTVPWVQFQSLPSFTTNLTGLGQMAATTAPTAANMGTMSALNGALNGMNGVSTMNGVTAAGLNGVNGISSVSSLNSLGLNGLSGLNTLNGLNGLNGLAAGHGGLVALPAAPTAHPTLALQQVLRRPHQPVPPPLAALIRAKKDAEFSPNFRREKRKAEDEYLDNSDIKKAKLETKALKAKRPGFSEERYNETSYYIENSLRKVYPYYFTFTTFTKGRWVGEKILDVFAKEFRAHPAEEYERCIKSGTLTVNYEKVDTDYRLKHNDLLANIVHRHETPVLARNIEILHLDEDLVVLDKPCSLPVHPCGRYRHNTVVFILAKEYNLKNLRTIHRLDRLTSGLLLFGRTPKKAREMEQQIRTRQVTKEYVCRVEGEFPREHIECNEPIEVVSYKIGVCKVSPTGKECRTEFQRLSYNGKTSVVLCRPHTGRMHQIRVHLQYLGFPIVNDPLYNHMVFGPKKGKGGIVGKTDEQLIQDLIKIHNAENWLGMDGDAEYSMFKGRDKTDNDEEGGSQRNTPSPKEKSPVGLDAPRVTSPPALIASTGYSSMKPISAHAPEIQSSMIGTEMLAPKTLNGCNSGLVGNDSTNVVSAGTQTSEGAKDYNYQARLMTVDEHCYECKVRYRDPKPKDLVMYLHALKYCGPGWQFETKLPEWANEQWREPEDEQ